MERNVAVKHLVLLGGGHSHLSVLRNFGMKPLSGVQITLVTKDIHTPYSGMIPGYAAGYYTFDECHIDLTRLAHFAKAHVVHAPCCGIDTDAQQLLFEDRAPLAYDCLSIDIGITPDTSRTPGMQHVVGVKPIDTFVLRYDALLRTAEESSKPLRMVVVGGGAGGVEVAFALRRRLSERNGGDSNAAKDSRDHTVTLLTRTKVLPSHPPRARTLLLQRALEVGVNIREDAPVAVIQADHIVLESQERVDYDECLWCVGASPATWLQRTSLPKVGKGFIAINEYLQSDGGPPNVFACGDVATSTRDPRPKAGVFAVRQGPPLADNLRRYLLGQPLKAFRPQTQWLSLITTGEQHAIATWGSFAIAGSLLWPVKDGIDRAFMRKFGSDLPSMEPADSGTSSTSSSLDGSGLGPQALASMPCRGCGSKLGSDILQTVLIKLGAAPTAPLSAPFSAEAPHQGTHANGQQRPVASLLDDAVIVKNPPDGHVAVQSVDFLSSCIDDPYLFGRIAALHSLSDVFAMGAQPMCALAIAQIPHAANHIKEAVMTQLMSGALQELKAAGCDLVGGHSCLGDLALGFSVTAHAHQDRIMLKRNLRPGQKLVLTKALGTGLVLRGGMLGRALGRWQVGAWESMTQSNGPASEILRRHGVQACTDVTGFGLLGHLSEMATSSQVHVSISLGSVPRLAGVERLMQDGIASTALESNSAAMRHVRDGDTARLLPFFDVIMDPQTSGGLLCAIESEKAERLMTELRLQGYSLACVVGEVLDACNAEMCISVTS